jgi:hypothetical protein
MKFTLKSKAKRSALAAFASGVAVVASLAVLPASPAMAYTEQCTTHALSTVNFKVCTLQINGTTARARVYVNSGTYISGTLYLLAPQNTAPSGCSGRHYPGGGCQFQSSKGRGIYRAQWISASNGLYNGPGVNVQ